MVEILKFGKSEEEIKDLENKEGKLSKKAIKRYLLLDAHQTVLSDDSLNRLAVYTFKELGIN